MPLFAATAAVMLLALLLGGGTQQGLASDAIVQLAGLPLLAVSLWLILKRRTPLPRTALIALAALLLLPLAQLIAMPPSLWATLPGRATIAAGFDAAGLPRPWLPLSLSPNATWHGFLSLIPAVAILAATVCLGWRERRLMTLLMFAFGLVSILLGLAQLMQGPQSPLRLFPVTNQFESVGFFANRNHYAALLYSLIPFTAAWFVGLLNAGGIRRVLALMVTLLVYVALLIGLGMAQSRAGLIGAVLATIAGLAIARLGAGTKRRAAVLGIGLAAAIGIVIVAAVGLSGIVGRIDSSSLSDARVMINHVAFGAVRAYLPFGSGFGSFVPTFQMFETAGQVNRIYVNHAHNDWMEISLEGGWPALAAAALFLLWFVPAALRAWRIDGPSPLDTAMARAGAVSIALLLLHSAVDYPLRTTTVMAVFAFCCALLIAPEDRRKDDGEQDRRRSRRRHAAPAPFRAPPRPATSDGEAPLPPARAPVDRPTWQPPRVQPVEPQDDGGDWQTFRDDDRR